MDGISGKLYPGNIVTSLDLIRDCESLMCTVCDLDDHNDNNGGSDHTLLRDFGSLIQRELSLSEGRINSF